MAHMYATLQHTTGEPKYTLVAWIVKIKYRYTIRLTYTHSS